MKTPYTSLLCLGVLGLALTSTPSYSAPQAPPVAQPLCHNGLSDAQAQSIFDLIERVTPSYSNQFSLAYIRPTAEGEDRFEISCRDNKIHLRGNNPIALATAYHHYLKYHCKAQLSWFGDQLKLPQELPRPQEKKQHIINGQYRVNFNYCTLSYTSPWWGWERWEREIDFMAMNSINTPLQAVGLDVVWYHTLLEMGFSDEEARGFLSLPGHQAWQWMTNIEGEGGAQSLPMSWLESHKELALKIYKRQLELGMQPIQQAFTGYVPRALKEKFSDANIALQKPWCSFKGVAMLDPLDPLFEKMGAIFLAKQKELFGAHGIYAADPFHENAPPSTEPSYLQKVGQAIYRVIKQSDPEAKVAMQSWSIRRPIAEQFPKDKLLILCIRGDKSDFWGYNFIVGRIHSWGGRSFMRGDIPHMASNPYQQARDKTEHAIGSGLFMEGMMQNPAYYALAYEMPLHQDKVDPQAWLHAYCERAYGAQSDKAQAAWDILLDSIYSSGTENIHQGSILASRPAINVKSTGFYCPTLQLNYDPQKLYAAQELLLADADKLKDSALYRFDIVDLQRQIMSNLAQDMHKAAMLAYAKKDETEYKKHSQRFLELMLDMDKMLSSRPEMNFDQWLLDARRWGTTAAEQDLFERDATELVSIWGYSPGFQCHLFDYSWREWSGLIRRYYHPRWEMFHQKLANSLKRGELYTDKIVPIPIVSGQQVFRSTELYNELADWEVEFVNTPKTDLDPSPQGDEVELAKEMHAKYKALNQDYVEQK